MFYSDTSPAGGVNPDEPVREATGPETASRPPARTPLGEGLSGLARDPIVLVGAVLIAAALLLRGWVLQHAYFVEDDFLFVAEAASSTLTFDYLTELHKGHLMPGAMLLAYVQTAVAPYGWPLAAGVMLAFQGGAVVALWRLLWVLFGRRWAILAPLAVYAFAPLTLPVLTWWSAALNAVPLQLAVALALLWTVRYLREGETRFAWWAVGAVLLGMAFSVKAMFLPPLLLAVAAAFCVPGRLDRAVRTALETRPRFWLGMAALTVGYLALYLTRPSGVEGEGAGAPDLGVSLALGRRMLLETFPAGAVGGPVQWSPVTPAGGLLDPDPVVLAVSWTVLGLLVAGSLLYRRRAWRAWAILVGYLVCVDALPTIIARGRYQDFVGHDPRYVADAALVFALCLALAFLPTRQERAAGGAYRNRRPPAGLVRAVTAVASALFVLAAGYSNYAYASTLSGDRVRWYLDTVRTSVAAVPDNAGIYPRPVPEDIVLPWNGPRRLSSYLLSPLAEGATAERIATPEPSALPLVFNDAGFLVNAIPAPDSAFFGPPEGEECVPTFGGQSVWPVQSLGGPSLVAGLAYTAEEETEATVVVGDAWVDTTLPAAPQGASWFVPVSGAGTQLLVHTEEREVCLKWVTFGELVPEVEGNPWHQDEEDEEGEPEPEEAD